MDLPTLFTTSFVVGFSGAMFPGPLLAVNIAETPRHGWKTGPIICIGHGIAEIAVVIIFALGLVTLSDDTGIIRTLAVVGGAALIAMGGMMLYDLFRQRVSYESSNDVIRPSQHLIGKGFTATISNPYWLFWWGTIGLSYVAQSTEAGFIGPVVFYIGHILSDIVWYTAVAMLIWSGRKLLLGRSLKILLTACAVFLLGLGSSFIYKGITGAM